MRNFLLRAFALGLLLFSFVSAQDRDGSFNIRFEPIVKLQAGPEIPFQITVKDSLRKPVEHAQVRLQITRSDGMDVKDFRSVMTAPGIYLAKPIFPAKGDWDVYVEVKRDLALSARTIQFQVTE